MTYKERKKISLSSEVAPWQHTRLSIGRSRVQIPWPANLVEVLSGFLNLKIAKELVIFKDKCRVGPHIQLQIYKFNVSQNGELLLK